MGQKENNKNYQVLAVVCGLPGTGKTTFALALAESLGADHLSSDMVRDRSGLRGHYDVGSKSDVYQMLLGLAKGSLCNGGHVVVDASFSRAEWRDEFHSLADDLKIPMFWFVTQADAQVVRTRVSKKRPFSEADYDVYQKIRDEFEPIEQRHLTLRSDKLTVLEMVNQALVFIEQNSPS